MSSHPVVSNSRDEISSVYPKKSNLPFNQTFVDLGKINITRIQRITMTLKRFEGTFSITTDQANYDFLTLSYVSTGNNCGRQEVNVYCSTITKLNKI